MERLQVDYIDIFQCHDIEFRNLDQVKQTFQYLDVAVAETATVVRVHHEYKNAQMLLVHACSCYNRATAHASPLESLPCTAS